jgi:hypothetical protein
MSKYKFTTVQRVAVWEAHERRCIYCTEPILFKDLHVDHIIPEYLLKDQTKLNWIAREYGLKTEFELNNYYNWVPSHNLCNSRKSKQVFSKARALFFLDLAERKYNRAVLFENKYKQRENKEKILINLAIAIEKKLLSPGEISTYLQTIGIDQPEFKLIHQLEFADQTIVDPLGKNNITELLERVVMIGDPNADGLELVNEEGITTTIRNCREFNDARAKGYYPLTTYAMKMASFFNRTCGILNALAQASIADKSYLENPHVGIVDINLLPVSLLTPLSPDDQGKIVKASASGKSLQGWVEVGKVKIKAVSQYSIHLLYGGMGQVLWELMRADLNNDGIEDILLYSYSYAVGGTFGYGDVEVITRLGPAEPFERVSTL